MRNLTEEILKSKEYQKSWTNEKLELLIESWGNADRSVRFDYDTDEQWVRVFKHNHVLGLIGINIPIMFLNERCDSFTNNYLFIKDIHAVRENDFDSPSWNINLELLKSSVPEITWHADQDAVNSECLSINDFWYATV